MVWYRGGKPMAHICQMWHAANDFPARPWLFFLARRMFGQIQIFLGTDNELLAQDKVSKCRTNHIIEQM